MSRLEHIKDDSTPINDAFPFDSLHAVSEVVPWYAPVANYLVSHTFPPNFTKNQRDKLRSESKYYIWDDPYFWRCGADQVIRRCVPQSEFQSILEACHSSESGGHFGPQRTARKILDCGFWWPTLFRDAAEFCKSCPHAKNLVIYPRGMRCSNNLCYSVKFFMSGALTLWVHFQTLMVSYMYC